MVGDFVHHLARGVAEVGVVLEEIAVPVDVGHDELLIDGVIAPHEVRVAGIVVDDHLVDFREAVLVAFLEFLILHPERPVRVASGEPAVRRDLVEVVGIDNLENGLVEIEAVAAGEPLDLVLEEAKVRGQVRVVKSEAHGSFSGHIRAHMILPVPGR